MPQPQVIDLSPKPRTERTALENTLSAFSNRLRENQKEQQETDALSEIYKKYQAEGRHLDDAIIDIQTRPGISPTTRVNSINQLLQFQKYNSNIQTKILQEKNKQEKEFLDEQKKISDQEKAKKTLKESGATDEQIKLYEVAPVGGQTKIIEDIIETTNRQKTPGTLSDTLEDFDKGLTPQERVKRQDQRYTTQTPLVNSNSAVLNSLQNEGMSIDLLNELNDSGKVGQGIYNLNINPKTGDLILPKAATPEEQLFVKTVNDFTVKAKDSFGARVTNFELDRFMQRLPTLANSEAGRRVILRQMKIINDLNTLEKKGIQDVFDQYGIRNIDYADAENKAREKIKNQKEDLRKEYLNLENISRKEESELIQNIKSKVKEGYTAMRKPDGTIKQFPTKNIPNLEDKGYKRL